MKNFILGFIAAVAIFILAIAGIYIYLSNEIEKVLNSPWEERSESVINVTIYPNIDIDLAEALGKNAQDLASFLSQGDDEKMKGLLGVFESGMNVTITSEFDDEGTSRTQIIYFKDGKTENRTYSAVAEVTLIRDPNPQTEIQGLEELQSQIVSLEELKVRAKEQRESVEALKINHRTNQSEQ